MLKLVEKYNKEAFHIIHAKTVSGVMGYFAKKYDPEHEEYWRNVGLIHDTCLWYQTLKNGVSIGNECQQS